MDLRNLYQEVIIDHNRNPRNFRQIEQASNKAEGFNPLCGDKVTLFLSIDSNRIIDASFQGCGCAISTASASLMTEYLKNKRVDDVEIMFETFHDALTQDKHQSEQQLGKLSVLIGVKEFPSRVKCATLAWHTLLAAIHNKETQVTTE